MIEQERDQPDATWKPGGLGSRAVFLLAALPLATACSDHRWDPVPGHEGAVKSSAQVRADRRLFDGAPPIIPHANFGVACGSCHDAQGISVPDLGFAPASPHDETREAGATQRCRQCHVFTTTNQVFVANSFQGQEQDLGSGGRLYSGAPPTIPHPLLLRENCTACHVGPGAREEIRTSHPERTRCRQCHVPVRTHSVYQAGEATRPSGLQSDAGPGDPQSPPAPPHLYPDHLEK